MKTKLVFKNDNEKMEYEANVFAVCLLIPKESLIFELNKLGGGPDLSDDTEIKQLANKFRVTITSLAFRLSLLK